MNLGNEEKNTKIHLENNIQEYPGKGVGSKKYPGGKIIVRMAWPYCLSKYQNKLRYDNNKTISNLETVI